MRIQILELPSVYENGESRTPFIVVISETGSIGNDKLQEHLASRQGIGAEDIWLFEGPVQLGPPEPTYPPNVITWGEPELPTEARKAAAETDLTPFIETIKRDTQMLAVMYRAGQPV